MKETPSLPSFAAMTAHGSLMAESTSISWNASSTGEI